jgi:hypothetical protein
MFINLLVLNSKIDYTKISYDIEQYWKYHTCQNRNYVCVENLGDFRVIVAGDFEKDITNLTIFGKLVSYDNGIILSTTCCTGNSYNYTYDHILDSAFDKTNLYQTITVGSTYPTPTTLHLPVLANLKSIEQPLVQPESQPSLQPVSQPSVSQPVSQPSISQPVSQPLVSQPLVSQPSLQPSLQTSISQPSISQSVSQPLVSQPSISQPSLQTSISQPVSQPASQPVSQPSSQPVIQNDGYDLRVLSYNLDGLTLNIPYVDSVIKNNLPYDFVALQQSKGSNYVINNMKQLGETNDELKIYYDQFKYILMTNFETIDIISKSIPPVESIGKISFVLFRNKSDRIILFANIHTINNRSGDQLTTLIDKQLKINLTSDYYNEIKQSINRIIVAGNFYLRNIATEVFSLFGIRVSYEHNVFAPNSCCAPEYNDYKNNHILDSNRTNNINTINTNQQIGKNLPVIAILKPLIIYKMIADDFGILVIRNQNITQGTGGYYVRVENVNVNLKIDQNLINIIKFNYDKLMQINNFIKPVNNINHSSLTIPISSFIPNLGNSCYFDSSLQLLFAIEDVRKFFLNNMAENLISQNGLKDIRDLFRTMATGRKITTESIPAYQQCQLSVLNRSSVTNEQGEASAVFQNILTILFDITHTNSRLKDKFTIISKNKLIYAGNTDIELSDNETNEPSIILNVNDNNEISVIELLYKKFEPTLIDYKYKKDYLFTFSKANIISTNKYLWLEITSQNNINPKIICNKYIQVNDKNYFLIGILLHIGNTNGGHYVTVRYSHSLNNQDTYLVYDDNLTDYQVLTLDSNENTILFGPVVPRLLIYQQM